MNNQHTASVAATSFTRGLRNAALGLFGLALLSAGGCSTKDTNVTPSDTPVKQNTATIQMAYKPAVNANPSCFFDLDNGAVYSVQSAPAHASEIDLLWMWRGCSDDGYFTCTEANNIDFIQCSSSGFSSQQLGVLGWSATNHTILNQTHGISVSDFDGVKNTDQLLTLFNAHAPTSSQTEELFAATSSDLSSFYCFETVLHKRGIIKIVSGTFNQGASTATVSIKIEP